MTPALTLIGRQVALRSDLHHAGRRAQGEEGDHPLERGHSRILQQVTYLLSTSDLILHSLCSKFI